MMKRRSVWWLFGSWIAYWLVLAAVKLGPAAMAAWKATHAVGTGSSVQVSVSNLTFNLAVVELGRPTWSGSIHMAALVAWIAVVPLALWFAWFAAARSDVPTGAARARSRATN